MLFRGRFNCQTLLFSNVKLNKRNVLLRREGYIELNEKCFARNSLLVFTYRFIVYKKHWENVMLYMAVQW